MRTIKRRCQRAFTLVEIIIVVVILGVLGAIVVPQFAGATDEAAAGATVDQLRKLRHAIAIYQVRNGHALPEITEGDGTWGEMVDNTGQYLRHPPRNLWVGGDNARVIIFGTEPDTEYQSNHGWIYDPDTGRLWAGSFDEHDQPIPKP